MGGHTRAHDIKHFEETLHALAPALWDDVRAYGVRYIRNYPAEGSSGSNLFAGAQEVARSWQAWQPNSTREEVMARLNQQMPSMDVAWLSPADEAAVGGTAVTEGIEEGPWMRTTWSLGGFATSPMGEEVWWNQLYGMNGRYWAAHSLDVVPLPLRPMHSLVGTADGAGREVTEAEWRALEAAHYGSRAPSFDYRVGDVLLLDNYRCVTSL
jgi:hypothetical protein